MAIWNRNKDNDRPVLPELQQYYDAERRERSGLAWILALVSVAAVALVVIGAFFGGRAIYRAVKDDDKQGNTVATQNNDDSNVPSVDGGANSGGSNNKTPPTPTSPTPASPNPANPPATPPAGGARPGTPSPTPSANTQSLPNTGPDGDY